MPAGFDAAFAKVKQLVADFRANEKFYLSPAYQEMSFAHWMGEGGRRPDEGRGEASNNSSTCQTVLYI